MTEVAIPEVVLENQIETPSTVPALSSVSLERLDAAVTSIEQAALAFKCETEEDYVAGGKAVARIRSLDTLFEDTFKPLKTWWKERWQEVHNDEQGRRGKLDLAKKTIGAAMLAYKAKKDREVEEQRKAEEALAKKRAEDELLARAEQVGDVAVLDEPLAIAPTYAKASVPKLAGSGGSRGVNTVKQLCVVGSKKYAELLKSANSQKRLLNDDEWKAAQEIDGEDLEDLILTIACSRIAYDMEAPPEVKQWAKARATRVATSAFVEAVPKALRAAASQKNVFFNVTGVAVVHKERLG